MNPPSEHFTLSPPLADTASCEHVADHLDFRSPVPTDDTLIAQRRPRRSVHALGLTPRVIRIEGDPNRVTNTLLNRAQEHN